MARHGSSEKAAWQRWLLQPQQLRLRRATLRVHRLTGLVFGLYVLFISLSGSVLVYRNELYAVAMPDAGGGVVESVAADAVSVLILLHAELLGGETGRRVNGGGATALLVSGISGLVVWWPGIRRWRRSLVVRRHVARKRLVWDLHGAVGIWSVGALMMFGASGLYLSIPDAFHTLADWLDPPSADTAGRRGVDAVLYWLAFAHFGRIDGIGLPCAGPGLCDQATKAFWALIGLTPSVLAATGALVWWNRAGATFGRRSAGRARATARTRGTTAGTRADR